MTIVLPNNSRIHNKIISVKIKSYFLFILEGNCVNAMLCVYIIIIYSECVHILRIYSIY